LTYNMDESSLLILSVFQICEFKEILNNIK